MAYSPSCSTRISANLPDLAALAPRVVKITTGRPVSAQGVGFTAVGGLVALNLVAHPFAAGSARILRSVARGNPRVRPSAAGGVTSGEQVAEVAPHRSR